MRDCTSSRWRSTRSHSRSSPLSRADARKRCPSIANSRRRIRRCCTGGIDAISPAGASRCPCSSATVRQGSATSSAGNVCRSMPGCSTVSRPTAIRSYGAIRCGAPLLSCRQTVRPSRRSAPSVLSAARLADVGFSMRKVDQRPHKRHTLAGEFGPANRVAYEPPARWLWSVRASQVPQLLGSSRIAALRSRCTTPRRLPRTAWRQRCFIHGCCRTAASARICVAPGICIRRIGIRTYAARGPLARCNSRVRTCLKLGWRQQADAFAPSGDWVVPVDPATASSLAGIPVAQARVVLPACPRARPRHARQRAQLAWLDRLSSERTVRRRIQRHRLRRRKNAARRVELRSGDVVRGCRRQRFRTGAVSGDIAGMGADRTGRTRARAGHADGRRWLHDFDRLGLGHRRHVRTETVGRGARDRVQPAALRRVVARTDRRRSVAARSCTPARQSRGDVGSDAGRRTPVR